MVTTHASIIQQVTTHFTTLTPRVAPTPAIDPLITWVDDTGIPEVVTIARTDPPDDAAQKP